jgi:N-acetylmuramoyl-L-alanine amidase
MRGLPSVNSKFATRPVATGLVATGFGALRGCALVAAALVLLPTMGVSQAGSLSDLFKGLSKHDKSHAHAPAKHNSSRHAVSPKHDHIKLAALGPANLNLPPLRSAPGKCEPATFRIVLDVGHTAESEGASSARNVPEFLFNLRLARRIEEKLKTEGFAETRLLVTAGKAKPSLARRVSAANDLHANLLLSIHHDSVPDKLLENWEFEGKKSYFSDRFSGYSVFVSRNNPDFKTSLAFAELVGKEMKAQGLQYAAQYTLPIMGKNQHPLLNKETGVYSYDKLIVLKKTRMPAVLLEAGSIINRDEELKMDSPERRDLVSAVVLTAVKEFCGVAEPFLGPL